MARIIRVNKAQKDQGTCGACHEPILKGSPYKHVTLKTGPRSSRRLARHQECPEFRPSQLTGSAVKSAVYAAHEATQDELGRLSAECGGEPSDVAEAVHAVAEGYRDAAEMRRESAQAIEDGFGHATSQSEELEAEAEELEAAADEIEAWEPTVDQPEDDLETPEEYTEAMEMWWAEVIEEADSFLGDLYQP